MEKLHLIYRTVILTLLLGHWSCRSGAQEPKKDNLESQIEIVSQQFELWKNGTASFFDLLADEATWEVAGRSPVSGYYEGKEAFTEEALMPILERFDGPLKPELISLSSDGTYVWLHFKGSTKTKMNGDYENTYLWKMQLQNGKIVHAVAFLDTYELVQLMQTNTTGMKKTMEETKGYLGLWVTKDGFIRQELLSNNRYDEARGTRKSAYQGVYKVNGNEIFYKDDTGFTADGTFIDENTLHHGGYIFYKK